ncbi:MAG: 6-phosphofructokinase [bacterium]|nr:6-phosphofructokinase [bacterium]
MNIVKGNMIIGQSGGPTAVINQSLVGAVKEAMKHPEITGIYGMKHGILGVLNEDFLDLQQEDNEHLEKIANTPASALGTCRYKPTPEDCEKVFHIFEKYNVKYWFYIGGNDTAETCHIVNEIARKNDYELRVFHIPKTIDNDLMVTDHCPGYPSAAKYVAMSFMGNNLDNKALQGVKIDIVMGRHAGWLTAAAALGKKHDDDGPHLIYLPEHPVALEQIVNDIDECYDKYGRCVVAVSEGVKTPDGKLLGEGFIKEKDKHGNVQLSGTGALGDMLSAYVRDNSKHNDLRVRSDTLGYAQRSFPGVYSEVDRQEARMVGEEAVKYAMQGDIDGSVALKRIGDYAVEPDLAKLKDVAQQTKLVPKEFINEAGNGVTQAFIDYASPLVGDLPVVERLKEVPVPKN